MPLLKMRLNSLISQSLNTLKNQIKSKYLSKIKGLIDKHLKDWDVIKKYTNTYEFIHTTIPGQKVSISKIKPISRAFFKLIEIYNTFDIFEDMADNINTFHLAEGPGGFIEATVYKRKSNKKDNPFWYLPDLFQCLQKYQENPRKTEEHF